jgi:hypothetical protein
MLLVDELSSIIPKAGSRLKLKKLIRESSVVTLDHVSNECAWCARVMNFDIG